MFGMIFFGGCVAGSAAEMFMAGCYKRQVQSRSAAATDAVKEALSCHPAVCIPGLSSVWNSAVSLVADSAARLRYLPQRLAVRKHAQRGYIGASDGVYAVSAAIAVRCIVECIMHDGGELGMLRTLLPVALFAVNLAT